VFIINQKGATGLTSKYLQDEEPWFLGAKLSMEESTLLHYAAFIRHRFSNLGLGDVLKLSNLHLPQGAQTHRSLYLLKKAIGVYENAAKKYYYCPAEDCHGPIDNATMTCPICRTVSSKEHLEKTENFFYLFDVRTSIKETLELSEVSKNLLYKLNIRNRTCGNLSTTLKDIIDGQEYKKLSNIKY